MQRTIHVTAILQNPDGVFEDDFRADFSNVPPQHIAEAEKAALKELSGRIYEAGGLFREISGTELEVIPLHRVRQLNLKIDSISIATALDVAAATGASTIANLKR